MKKRLNIKAILDSDMDKILNQIGMIESIEDGKVKCAFCNKNISRENIAGIFTEKKQIRFCCNSIECYERLVKAQLVGE